MPKTKNDVAEYRSYYLPSDFPVLLLSGEHWKISNIPSKHLHFHNCLEIGMCHSESGYMEFNGKALFQRGGHHLYPAQYPPHDIQLPGHPEPLVISVFEHTGAVQEYGAPDPRV